MKFAMITTFFGAHSFGGDAAYVERLEPGALPARPRGSCLLLCRRLQCRAQRPPAAVV